jgi:IPT/TIG domain
MAVRDDPPAGGVEEIGRGRVGPVGIVLTAVVLLSLTIVLLYGIIQFWPPAPAATTTAVATTTSTTTATGQPTPGTTGQAVMEPAVQFFGATVRLSREGRLFVIVLLAGALGGMVHTLRSLYWYVGNRNLRYSWLLMYVTLPITGAALALIAYVVLRGGLTTTFASAQDISPFGMAAVAALVGLFSRETAEKLRAVFETLLAPAEKGKDQAVPVQVERIHPGEGGVGNELTITGTGFAAATAVQFGGVRATPMVISDTELRVRVPEGAAKGPISVVTPTGMTASTDTFIPGAAQVGQPRIDRFEPATGKVEDEVVITGSGFTGASEVQIGGVSTPVITGSDTQLRVKVPRGAATGPITVTVGTTAVTSATEFTVT